MHGATPLNELSVLVLEDDFYLAEDTKAVLEEAGATVVGPFRAAERALEAARRQKADCAVVDVNLGGGPNFTAAESFVAMGVPVVFITGYDSHVIPEALAHLPCLQKPTDARKIVAAVAQVCGRQTA